MSTDATIGSRGVGGGSVHSWIEGYRSRGLRPLPVYPPSYGCRCLSKSRRCAAGGCHGKMPMIEHWADQDPSFIAAQGFPEDVNVALAMGQQTDGRWLMAVDVDGDAIFDLQTVLGPLPLTMVARTGRGRHHVFEVEPDVPLGNWVGLWKSAMASIDIRYCRGAIVAPPSMHRNGERYEWVSAREPSLLPYVAMNRLMMMRRARWPDVKRYSTWTGDPAHKGKRP